MTIQPTVTPPTDEELLRLFEDGLLAAAIGQGFGLDTHEEAVVVEDRCLALHEAGRVDLLAIVEEGLDDISPGDFFTLQHFLNRVLPQLSADPDRVMAVVEALVAKGGEDLASNLPNAALVEWCKADPKRGSAVITAAWAGNVRAGANLTFALQGLGAIAEARRFVTATDDARRLSGMTALGRLPDPDASSRAESLRVLQAALGNHDDDGLGAHVLQASAAIAVQSEPLDPIALETMRRVLSHPGDGAKNRAAHILWGYPDLITPETLDILLPALVSINPEHGATARELDTGLAELVRRGHGERAVDHVAAMFVGQKTPLKLDTYRSALEAIVRAEPALLSRAVCSWLLTGERRLGEGLSKALARHERDNDPLILECRDLPKEPALLGYLCRKIVGWFFLQPRTMSSALVSILSSCSSEAAPDVQALLTEIVLRNYGSIRDDLEALPTNHPAKARVQACLAANDSYLEGLHKVGEIKELRPPETHRQIAYVRQAEMMREAQKAAEAQSPLLSMVRRSTLLYGRRSLNFVRGPQGEVRPMEIELATHSVMVEIPRTEIVDPIGLQILLYNLRFERRPT